MVLAGVVCVVFGNGPSGELRFVFVVVVAYYCQLVAIVIANAIGIVTIIRYCCV